MWFCISDKDQAYKRDVFEQVHLSAYQNPNEGFCLFLKKIKALDFHCLDYCTNGKTQTNHYEEAAEQNLPAEKGKL